MREIEIFKALVKVDMRNEYLSFEAARNIFLNILNECKSRKGLNKKSTEKEDSE